MTSGVGHGTHSDTMKYLDDLIARQRKDAFDAHVRVLKGRIESTERAMRGTTDPKVRARQQKNLARHQYTLSKIIAEWMSR